MAGQSAPSRAEFTILKDRVDGIERNLDEALLSTGCIDPANIALDRAARVRQAWRQTPEGQEFEAALRNMVAEWEAAKRNEANKSANLGKIAVGLGIFSTFILLVQQVGEAFFNFISERIP